MFHILGQNRRREILKYCVCFDGKIDRQHMPKAINTVCFAKQICTTSTTIYDQVCTKQINKDI